MPNRKIVQLAIPVVVAFAVLIGALATQTATADASTFRPVPEYIYRAAIRSAAPPAGTTSKRAWAICRVFGGTHRRCRYALNVSYCESGLRPWAQNPNGRRGLWQFGPSEIRTYGYGSSRDTWGQARGGYAYYRAAGWGPWGKWGCRPYRTWPHPS